jgi:hypothetical protein
MKFHKKIFRQIKNFIKNISANKKFHKKIFRKIKNLIKNLKK